MRHIYGDRIGATGRLVIGCSTFVLNADGDSLLLVRRSDNGQWCLPSGAMEPGESAEEAAIRETLEETGLHVALTRLIGVYSDPHVVSEYQDGNRYHVLAMLFEAHTVGGELTPSEETTEVAFVPIETLDVVDIIEPHRDRIPDGLAKRVETVFR